MTVEICFFADSYRKVPPFGSNYCPHLVLKGSDDLLGVRFSNLEKRPFGEKHI